MTIARGARGAWVALALASASMVARAQPPVPTIVLRPGLVITSSVRIARQSYRLPAPASLDSALITIRGDDIVVDFDGAELEGIDPTADPDLATGVAVRIEGGRNVRLAHATIRGYKIAVLARGTRHLALADNDLSHNWKPRLYSLVEHESLVDWLSFHHDEKREWQRFGAAIYLDGVHGGEIRGNRGEQGMNGLLMVGTDSVEVRDNSFSFNSGLGVGLYRSSRNLIVHNRVDYNVRGYSHGYYRRGQDSAGILLYEQSSRNMVGLNSVTHGGDGLFLWAGQSTMDTGEGGSNDNAFERNDFSYAPTNGMEATFSRNQFSNNRVLGNDHGLWGGYSFATQVVANCFAHNRIAIAIEHGQSNEIAGNWFGADSTAISLWANPEQPSDWGYPRHRDTRSRDYRIVRNTFIGNRVGVRLADTRPVRVDSNHAAAVDSFLVLRDSGGIDVTPNVPPWSRPPEDPGADCFIPKGNLTFALSMYDSVPTSSLAQQDRSAIVVDEWGPYDWRSPKLWPIDSTRAVPLRLRILGPPGAWKAATRRGLAHLSAESGTIGDTIAVTPAPDAAGDWELTLEYTGDSTVSPRGARRGAGVPYRFSYGRFQPATDWNVRFFAWDEKDRSPTNARAFAALLRSRPLITRRESRLDYEWYRPPIKEIPAAHWALEARATVTLPEGEFTLRAISDDAVRVWVDGALVIDRWTPHESAVDVARLSGGRRHQLRVQYYQVDGWTELRVDIVRGHERAGGSPGPH